MPIGRGAPYGPGRVVISSSMRRPAGGLPATASLEVGLEANESLVGLRARSGYLFRRAERYLCLFAGLEIPFEMEVLGVEGWGSHYTSAYPAFTSAQQHELPEEIEQIYAMGSALLAALPEDSYVGKAAENLGQAAIDGDPDKRFAQAWNAIELVAKAFREDREAKMPPHRRPLRRGRESAESYIGPMLEALHDGPAAGNLAWLTKLRNGAVHGGCSDPLGSSYQEYAERWDKAEPMRDLGFEVLINYLGERGAIPKWKRPVRPRVMVGSLGVDPQVRPIDESGELATKGTRWSRKDSGKG